MLIPAGIPEDKIQAHEGLTDGQITGRKATRFSCLPMLYRQQIPGNFNKRICMKVAVLIRLLDIMAVCLYSLTLNCQELIFSKPIESSNILSDYTILRQQDNNIFLLNAPPAAVPEILIFSNTLQQKGSYPAGALRNGSMLAIKQNGPMTEILAEYSFPESNIYKVVTIDSGGKTVSAKEVASVVADPATGWSFVKSPAQVFSLLYKVNKPENDTIRINFVLLDSLWNTIDRGIIEVPFSAEFDRLNPIYADDEGKIWIAIFDQPLNYKLGATVKLFCYGTGFSKLLQTELRIEEKKPVEFLFLFDNKRKVATLHSLYAGFHSRNIEGYLFGVVNYNLEEIKSFTGYEFDAELKKEMQRSTVGITRNDLLNYLRLHKVSGEDNADFITIASLNYSEYRFTGQSFGKNANLSSSLTEQNPLRTSYQRDALIRQLGAPERRRGRVSRIRDGVPSQGSSAPFSEAMRLRPDLFFFPENGSAPDAQIQTPVTSRKIYDKYLFISFDKNLKPGWQQWFKKEYFLRRDLNTSFITENSHEIISFIYQHNKKEKVELLVSVINKKTGDLNEIVFPLQNDYPLFLRPPVKISDKSFISICAYNEPGKYGLAKLTW